MHWKASCSQCKYREDFHEILCSYQITENRNLTIRQTFAWCNTCKKVVWAEKIEDVSRLEKERLSMLKSNTYAWLPIKPEDQEAIRVRSVEDIDARIEWRKARISPPRCMECGSINIVFSEEYKRSGRMRFDHPSCSGIITVKWLGESVNMLWYFYTPEGEKIAEYNVSPSKGLIPRIKD